MHFHTNRARIPIRQPVVAALCSGRLWAAVATAVMVLASPFQAQARPNRLAQRGARVAAKSADSIGARVVVLASGGRQARGVQNQIVSALTDSGVEVFAAGAYADRARQLGVSKTQMVSPDGVRQVAAEVDIDGVVSCTVFKKKRKTFVKVALVDVDGNRQVEKTYRLSKRGLPGGKARQVAGSLRDALPARAHSEEDSGSAMNESAPDSPGQLGSDQGGAAGAMDAGNPWGSNPYGDGASPSQDAGSDDAVDGSSSGDSQEDTGLSTSTRISVSRRKRSGDSNVPLANVRLTGGVGGRTYDLSAADKKFVYRTTRPWAEAGVIIDAHPLRDFGTKAAAFGLEVLLARGFGTSELKTNDGEASDPIKTPVTRIHVDLGYAIPFGNGDGAPSLELRGGWSSSLFDVPQPNDVFTAVQHKGLRGGALFNVPIVPGFADVEALAYYVPKATPSAAETNAHGAQTAGSGYGGRLALLGTKSGGTSGITWGLWGEVQSFKAEFKDAASEGVTQSKELSWSATAALGYSY